MLDSLSQLLTSAPLLVQIPLVMAVVLPVAGVGAFVLLRVIDTIGELFGRVRGQPNTHPRRRGDRAG